MILTHLQNLPNNVGDLAKIIVATGFEWLPKVQKIAQSGHTGPLENLYDSTRWPSSLSLSLSARPMCFTLYQYN